jgi:hypothetical protein
MVAFGQRGHFWAVDWLYPQVWFGTVATTFAGLKQLGDRPFNRMRDARNLTPNQYQDAGWHLSWLGGVERDDEKTKRCETEKWVSVLHLFVVTQGEVVVGFHGCGEIEGMRNFSPGSRSWMMCLTS